MTRGREPSAKPSENLSGVDTVHDPRFDAEGHLIKKPGPLTAENREMFCQLYALQGYSKTESYTRAGYSPKTRARASIDANKLGHCDDIKARIHELRLANGAHDEAADARDNPEITTNYINTQMKLLLVQAKHENQLKLARDILVEMGKELGMYNNDKKDNSNDTNPLLGPPNHGGVAINISEVNQIVAEDTHGSRSGGKKAKVINQTDD